MYCKHSNNIRENFTIEGKIYQDHKKEAKRTLSTQDRATVYVQNDLVNYNFELVSSVAKTANKSYDFVKPHIGCISNLLKEKVNNLDIKYNTRPEYEYVSPKKLLGYVTTITITFDLPISNDRERKNAMLIQDKLMGMKTTDSQILLSSIYYDITNKLRKQTELAAIEKATNNALQKAKAAMKAANISNFDYQIENIDVQTEFTYGTPVMYSVRNTAEDTSTVSSGKKSVSATVTIKVIM